MGIPARRRDAISAERDDESSPRVVAINEDDGAAILSRANPIGRRLVWGDDKATDFEIIAVVRDVKQAGPRDEPQLRFYLPYRSIVEHAAHPGSWPACSFSCETASDPVAMLPVLQTAVAAEDLDCPSTVRISRPRLVESHARAGAHDRHAVDRLRHVGRRPRVYRPVWVDWLSGRAAHERDRHSHGARRAAVAGVVGDASAGAGVDSGRHRARNSAGAQSVAHSRKPVVRSEPDGHGDAGGAAIAMLAFGVLAAYIPAHRASRIDPLAALRYE